MVSPEKVHALIIVNVQNDFCSGGLLAVTDGDTVVPVINDLIERPPIEVGWTWRIVVATRDYHPEKSDHFEKWPAHCVMGTLGVLFHPDLRLPRNTVIISKGTQPKGDPKDVDGYSGFDGTAKGKTLHQILQAAGITTLWVAGLATDYCVKATVLDARRHGFEVYVVSDGCRGFNRSPEDSGNAFREMHESGAWLHVRA